MTGRAEQRCPSFVARMLRRPGKRTEALEDHTFSSLHFDSAVNRSIRDALKQKTKWSISTFQKEEIMKKLIAILMASLFAVGAAYAADAKKDDKKADAKKEAKK